MQRCSSRKVPATIFPLLEAPSALHVLAMPNDRGRPSVEVALVATRIGLSPARPVSGVYISVPSREALHRFPFL